MEVDEATLAEIVRRLVEAIDPDKIILFGSRAERSGSADCQVGRGVRFQANGPGVPGALGDQCAGRHTVVHAGGGGLLVRSEVPRCDPRHQRRASPL